MPSREFRVALRFRLDISMFPSPSDAKLCACGAIIDSSGDHLLGCNQAQNLRTKRHNALCDVLFNAFLVDDSRCRREMRCDSTSEARPGDIFHPDFERGLPLTLLWETPYNQLTSSKQPLVQVQQQKQENWRKTNGMTAWFLAQEHLLSYCGGVIGTLVTKQSASSKNYCTKNLFSQQRYC